MKRRKHEEVTKHVSSIGLMCPIGWQKDCPPISTLVHFRNQIFIVGV